MGLGQTIPDLVFIGEKGFPQSEKPGCIQLAFPQIMVKMLCRKGGHFCDQRIQDRLLAHLFFAADKGQFQFIDGLFHRDVAG